MGEFGDLYAVTAEVALNFWVSNLRETMGWRQWSEVQDPIGLYLASVLGHFCQQSVDRKEILSDGYAPSDGEFRQFADLTQIAEMMMQQLTIGKSPRWMESAGAHILLYAGFFYRQNRGRHNIDFFSKMGVDCYRMAAVGERAKVMRLVAKGFRQYLFSFAELHRHLREKRYLIA